MLLFALPALFALLSHAQSNNNNNVAPVLPSNTSSFVPSSNVTQQLVLGLPITPAGANDPQIFALTDVAFDLPSKESTTQAGVGDHLWNTDTQTSTNISMSRSAIAYISCDPQNYAVGNIGLSNVLDNAVTANVSAVLFYSIDQDFCLINGTLSPSQSAFGRYFTMTSAADAARVSNSITGMLAQNSGAAEIMTQAAYNNVMNAGQNSNGIDNTPSTAVAMIILYSITGVITALFLVIIITGAVRAHRHPERYGPNNVLGRARQSRAKGIARAMLDTIPIVKFGEKQPAKPGDIELAEPSSSAAAAAREANEQTDEQPDNHSKNEGTDEVQPVDSHSPTSASNAVATASDSNQDHSNTSPTDEDITCSICTEDFEKGQDLRVLPCDHKFHPACVDPWLLDVSGTCPLCRVDLRPKEEQGATEGTERDNQRRGSREGEPLPPPLNPGRNRRRETILHFLDRRRMQDSNPEERISALRRWRQASRRSSRVPPQENAGESSGQNGESSNQGQR